MLIRRVKEEEIDDLVTLGGVFFKETEYWRYFSYEEDKVKTVVCELVKNGVALVAEGEAGIAGFAGGLMLPFWFNTTEPAMHVMAMWVNPIYEGSVGVNMIRRLNHEAQKKGCQVVIYSDLALRNGRVGRLFHSMGMRKIETNWICEV